ncbi:MAG TPA: 6-pyruvoyl-tetrahydropterin synthase-related protein [Luteitalea sp.]|nr:6-pyruvoyl-tetrahydropterin synthase-related protein [Luteitalea sp.]
MTAGGEARRPGATPSGAEQRLGAWHATIAFALLAVAWTWPVVTGLVRDLPWDLGDPLLNCWILAWHYHQAGRLLHGDVGALADWWHPNIFHPAQYTLGHSELLIGQAVLGAPVYALTGNILLTYNLLFLSSFVLAALGAFLFVRHLTGRAYAGLVAGLLYGFALYRVNQGPHLQVLSAQWFPFVLWGLHRWWDGGRRRDAVLAGLALALQNLSNGYFLVYAALWLPIYVCAQIALRGRLRDLRAWLGPVITATVGIGLTAPFLYPYVQLKAQGQPARPLAAVVQYSADTYAWLTANDQLWFWGARLQRLVRPEGDLFAGLVPIGLAVVVMGMVAVQRWRGDDATGRPPVWRRAVAVVAAVLTAGHVIAILLALFGGVVRLRLGVATISISDGTRLLVGFVVSLAVLLFTSPRARRVLRDEPSRPVFTWALLAALTVWLSFGPIVAIGGRYARSWPSLYAAVYHAVPGADALRVPPRIAMVTALALAVLGGLAAAELLRRRGGHAATALLAAAFVVESWPAPVPTNLRIDPSPLTPFTDAVPSRPADDPLARAIAGLPADAVIVDLPFGSVPYEVWWQYLSIGHWRARVNGYSGDFPPGFLALDALLARLPGTLLGGSDGAEALAVLREHGVTHVVLHTAAWPSPSEPDAVRAWLTRTGASRATSVSGTEIWHLPR